MIWVSEHNFNCNSSANLSHFYNSAGTLAVQLDHYKMYYVLAYIENHDSVKVNIFGNITAEGELLVVAPLLISV